MSTPHALDAFAEAISVVGQAVAGATGVPHDRPTPCTGWNLGTLVRHVSDSARSLREILCGVAPGLPPPPGCAAAQASFRELAEVVRRAPREAPAVALIALTGSYELAIHGWDIAETTGNGPALPAPLVEALLIYAPVVLADVERAGLFAAPRDPGARCSDNDRLLAMFGRGSDWRRSGNPDRDENTDAFSSLPWSNS
jgi:uncharacterized protein (TIGR03083 family)